MNKKYITPGGNTYAIYTDSLRQPHLLIAGATGSGKSVIVNALIHAALLRLPGGPDGARLILIDPKRVELAQWRDMPHTVKYASEPDEMREALNLAIQITEKRYRQLQRKRLKKYSGPDLYVIVDEFADLMTTQRKHIAPTIQRLAQIGRAARVHLIIATQSPIRAVIPTEIKCNFDSRFGLRTRSAQDSRNIIEHAGLERLPRYGQAVYMTPEGEQLYNIPMIPDTELSRVAKWWTSRKCKSKIFSLTHRKKRSKIESDHFRRYTKMKKIINGLEFIECTAIAVGVDNERQPALFVHQLGDEFRDGDAVVFGYGIPEDENDVRNILDDSSAWDSDAETIKTVEFI